MSSEPNSHKVPPQWIADEHKCDELKLRIQYLETTLKIIASTSVDSKMWNARWMRVQA